MKIPAASKPRLAYGAFAALSFLLALRWTFPSEAVKERLILEAGSRGWQIDAQRVTAGGFFGVRARDVKLDTGSGLPVVLDDVRASLRLLPLLTGRRSVAFDAHLYDGRVQGTADLSGVDRRLVADVEGVDLAAALPLRQAARMDLVGRVHGTADVVAAGGGQRLTGQIDLRVAEAGLSGGQLPVAGMTGGIPLPQMDLGEVTAAVKLGDGRATFERLEATGGDAELRTEGLYVVVQPRLESSPLFGRARLRVLDAFWSKSGAQGFKGLADAALANAKGADGAWSFDVTGSLGHPRVLPARVP
jgi:type II secretion system protein N